MSRDKSKYLFNGKKYGKGRLVPAVVSKYIEKHQPTIQELKQTFPKELQGSFGVFNTEQEVNDRSDLSIDRNDRFFTNDKDRLSTKDRVLILKSLLSMPPLLVSI